MTMAVRSTRAPCQVGTVRRRVVTSPRGPSGPLSRTSREQTASPITPGKGRRGTRALSAAPRRRSAVCGGVSGEESGLGTLKAEVLRRITEQRKGGSKGAVLEAVKQLEEKGGGVTADVSGRWTLVYSTREAEKETKRSNEMLQQATDTLYKFFFRFAPALAGSQETGVTNTSNEQIVDLQAKVVDNIVLVDLGENIGRRAKIRVWGTVETIADQEDTLQVTFTGWSISLAKTADSEESLLFKLPLPKPRGLLKNTFCDGNMRISRGGRGGLFVTKRIADR